MRRHAIDDYLDYSTPGAILDRARAQFDVLTEQLRLGSQREFSRRMVSSVSGQVIGVSILNSDVPPFHPFQRCIALRRQVSCPSLSAPEFPAWREVE